MKKLNKDPYKGTRDFYPEDMAVQNYIFSKMREIPERYGYVEYNGPMIEELDLFRAKTGEEIVNEQTYSFKDRGDREVSLRPEMTPTLARMVARKRKELAFPVRWYCIENNYRYERPQKGRLREFWQLNVDIFGVEDVSADAETMSVSRDIMLAYGVKEDQFEIRINNRRYLDFLLKDYLQLDEQIAKKFSKLADRMTKLDEADFNAQLEEIVGNKKDNALAALKATSPDKLPQELRDCQGMKEIREILQILYDRGINNAVFDPSIIRGFDYYTGPVFEVFDVSTENNRSLFGGGRYDTLVDMFGVEPITGTGFAMGDVTMGDVLETYKLLPEYQSSAKLYICTLEKEYIPTANNIATKLREQDINVAVDFTDRKVGAQIKTADKQKIPYILVIGEDEKDASTYKIKRLADGEEIKLDPKNPEALK